MSFKKGYENAMKAAQLPEVPVTLPRAEELPEVVDIDAPEGYETAEVSEAKDIVMDIVQEVIAECFLICGSEEPDDTREMHGYDAIESAHNIVEALIKAGWRPTKEIPA